MKSYQLPLIGYASKLAGPDLHCDEGPVVLQQSPYLAQLVEQGIQPLWQMITPGLTQGRKDKMVREMCERLAAAVVKLAKQHQYFTVIGGDHACAIGTWSGMYDVYHTQGELGLIWVDAHMDSHTPETSESGRIHGMALAALLGFGYDTLTTVLHDAPKLKPENVCLVGVRSFEQGEAALLARLGVRIYFMEEVRQRGVSVVLREAVQGVSQHTIGYGISLDLDSLDPEDAPGVDVAEPAGLRAADLLVSLAELAQDPRLLATEIVEFDPSRDKSQQTEQLIVKLLTVLSKQSKDSKDKNSQDSKE
ncbi:MAG TPA: arginase [Gammaproteobacteria bacterium]|jgi:arginase|nr:arginase [Gammaproteobacteria bacterium]